MKTYDIYIYKYIYIFKDTQRRKIPKLFHILSILCLFFDFIVMLLALIK